MLLFFSYSTSIFRIVGVVTMVTTTMLLNVSENVKFDGVKSLRCSSEHDITKRHLFIA